MYKVLKINLFLGVLEHRHCPIAMELCLAVHFDWLKIQKAGAPVLPENLGFSRPGLLLLNSNNKNVLQSRHVRSKLCEQDIGLSYQTPKWGP